MLTMLVYLGLPFAALYGLHKLSRWYAGRRDPIDTLIRAPRWCVRAHGADGQPTAWMNRLDAQKMERAGEVRWQETLRAQRKARKPVPRSRPTLVKDARRRA